MQIILVFFLLFLNLAYWYPYICLYKTMNKIRNL